MCYDISFTVHIKELSDYFPDLIFDEQMEIDFEKSVHIVGHGYGEHAIIYRNREDQQLHCKLMEWGCIPHYTKDEDGFKRQRATMLNARSERVLSDAKSYWFKIRNRRCLVPMNAMYEHRDVAGWKKKVPYIIGLKHQKVFFIPGLYSVAELPDKQTGELIKRWTYTLLTRDGNNVMKMIHNGGENKGRMPLYLTEELTEKWLSEDLSEDEYKNILNFEMPGEELQYHPVYTIRSPKERPDGKIKSEFYEWPGLPELS